MKNHWLTQHKADTLRQRIIEDAASNGLQWDMDILAHDDGEVIWIQAANVPRGTFDGTPVMIEGLEWIYLMVPEVAA